MSKEVKKKGWIGVDLDGTLAFDHSFDQKGSIGMAVPSMLARVKTWLVQGYEVRVVTARACERAKDYKSFKDFSAEWLAWCKFYGLPALPLTAEKDFSMIELWDDRAVAVEANTGRALSKSRLSS